MEEICRASGAERYLMLKMQGLAKRAIGAAVHNGGPPVDAVLGVPGQIVIERLVVALSVSRLRSLVIGGVDGFPLEIPGFAHGVATVTRNEHFGCIVVFAREQPAVHDGERMLMLSNATLAAQMAMSGFVPEPAQPCPLRGRELECLRHYVAGHTPKQTGEALGISERTVEGHLDRVRLRCGVETTLGAAMKALQEGWIEPSEVRQLEAAG